MIHLTKSHITQANVCPDLYNQIASLVHNKLTLKRKTESSVLQNVIYFPMLFTINVIFYTKLVQYNEYLVSIMDADGLVL